MANHIYMRKYLANYSMCFHDFQSLALTELVNPTYLTDIDLFYYILNKQNAE